MKNSDLPAMPCQASIDRNDGSLRPYQFGSYDFVMPGLSKREAFAMAAMQGLCAREGYGSPVMVAHDAVAQADALLAELEKEDGS